MVNPGAASCQIGLKQAERGRKASDRQKSTENRPEEAVLLLEAMLILREEAVEVMEDHPIEDRALGMSGTIDSGHDGRMASRNGPSSRSRLDAPEKTGKAPVWRAKPGQESINRSCRLKRRMERAVNRAMQREYSTPGIN